MRKPLFLDRDGVLNEDITPYIRHRSQLKVFSWTPEALEILDKAGYDLFVISNQQGVALGITPQEELDGCTEILEDTAKEVGVKFKKFYYCTFHDRDQHPWRKPSPGMILSAGEDFGFDPKGAFVIGDKWTDMEAAARAGCRGILVLTGVTPGDESWLGWNYPPERVFANVKEAAEWIASLGTL